jgi:hypothetical protein
LCERTAASSSRAAARCVSVDVMTARRRLKRCTASSSRAAAARCSVDVMTACRRLKRCTTALHRFQHVALCCIYPMVYVRLLGMTFNGEDWGRSIFSSDDCFHKPRQLYVCAAELLDS